MIFTTLGLFVWVMALAEGRPWRAYGFHMDGSGRVVLTLVLAANYLLLTNLLPDLTNGTQQGGNGQFVLSTYAVNVAGTYTARLTVSDGRGGQDSATVRVDPGNDPPQPAIGSPSVGERFSVGESLLLIGSAKRRAGETGSS